MAKHLGLAPASETQVSDVILKYAKRVSSSDITLIVNVGGHPKSAVVNTKGPKSRARHLLQDGFTYKKYWLLHNFSPKPTNLAKIF